MMKAKTILKDKFWIVESDGERVGTLSLSEDKYLFSSGASTQYFDTIKFSQKNVGKQVKSLNNYKNGQVIIGSDRLVFDARKDELLLISKKDVKIATPSWQTDMNEFFTQIEAFINICVEQAQGAKPYATPTGPTGPSSALPELQKIQAALKQMKQ